MNKLKDFFASHFQKNASQLTTADPVDPVTASKKLNYTPHGGPYDMIEDIPPEDRA